MASVMLCLSGLFGTWHCQMIVVMRMLEAFFIELHLNQGLWILSLWCSKWHRILKPLHILYNF